tara:strand:+ start:82 stop:474 length:393 start_codon:yes stop_codon:yes gene_type:complete
MLHEDKMTENNRFTNYQNYLKTLSPEAQVKLDQLRDCIMAAAPNATELMNYNLPAFALVKNAKRDQQIMIAGYKEHVGLYPHPAVIEHFKAELTHFKSGKGSIQFEIDKPLPVALIKRMVKFRLNSVTKG